MKSQAALPGRHRRHAELGLSGQDGVKINIPHSFVFARFPMQLNLFTVWLSFLTVQAVKLPSNV